MNSMEWNEVGGMSNDFRSARFWAAEIIENAMQPGARAVDATLGNGHDALWLCDLVGERGHVYGFDVQREAVDRSAARLAENGVSDRATLICDGHQNVRKHVEGPVDAVLFNLGWLPGGDHSCTTRLETTLAAVSECLELLAPGGLMTICAYPGHEEGARELNALLDWAENLNRARYSAMVRRYVNQKTSCPPVLFAIGRTLVRQ